MVTFLLQKKYQLQRQLKKIFYQMKPSQIILLSFLLVIFVGSLLLMLPFSQAEGAPSASYIDALFTSVSATCVTGLVTVTTATQWSIFGQIVILCLIQIGGLSFVTIFSFFLVSTGKKISVRNRVNIQESVNQSGIGGVLRTVLFAIKTTLVIEGLGAILLTIFFWTDGSFSLLTSLYYGIFHSISAFCNAGFDLLGETSLELYRQFPLMNFTVMLLIISGGIGFSVWFNLYSSLRQRKKRLNLSLHSKLALITTLFLLVLGAGYFFITEYSMPNTLGPLSIPQKAMAAFFQSTTLRTAGFYTIPQGNFSESSQFVSCVWMLIGGSPGGTAGGIKTVTLAVIFCTIWSTLRGKDRVDVFGRHISKKLIFRSISVMVIMLLLWFFFATMLEFTESGSTYSYTFMDLLFEVSSALGTVGLTTGITPYLSNAGKIIIMLSMFIGRLGPMGIAISLQRKFVQNGELKIAFPSEEVSIG